jgi:DNA polymerase
MTTEEYVRHEEFQLICVAVKRNNEPAKVCWGNMALLKQFLDGYQLEKCAVLCHHAAFDGFILNEHFDIRPKFWFDTLSMSRPIHNVYPGNSLGVLAQHYGVGTKGTEVVDAMGKRQEDFSDNELDAYVKYCAMDVDLTFKIFHPLKKYFRPTELMVIDTTIRMFTEPKIMVDARVLSNHLVDVRNARAKLLEKLGGEKAATILRSNPKFAKLLEKLGVTPPMKTSLTTGKETYAFAKTDPGFKALLDHHDPKVRMVTEARLGTKSSIEETRTLSLLGVYQRGALPIMLNYYGAHTGRFSGGDGMNLQNLPARGNNKIRTALCAPDGYLLAVADSAQIEARIVAWLAGQEDLVQAFHEGRDVYCEFATDVYGREITKADTTERFVGKTCILGLGYGMGAEKFRETVALGGVIIDEVEAKRIVDLYRAKYFKIPQLWRRVQKALDSMVLGGMGVIADFIPFTPEGFVLPNGMVIRYYALQKTSDGLMYANMRGVATKLQSDPSAIYKGTKIYGGKGVENIVQALARIVITDQMLVVRMKHNYPVLFQVHDELIYLVPEADADECMENILHEMSQPPSWAPDIPVACEGGLAINYGEAK